MALIETLFDDAAGQIRRERRRTADELQAFRAFRSAVADVRATAQSRQTEGPLATQTTGYGGASPSLTTVRREYERTVMAVPHYEKEYGDTYAESVAAEFGEDVGAALTGAGVGSLTPTLRRALVSGATAAMDERTEFVSILDAESESIEASGTAVRSVEETLLSLDDGPLADQTFDTLVRRREEVGTLRDRLDDAAARRQETIRDHRRALTGFVPDVTAYLYDPLPVEYPALDALARLREVVETALHRLDRRLLGSL